MPCRTKKSTRSKGIANYDQLPQNLIDQITHFFERYKDLEPGKWVKVDAWGDAEEAKKMIAEGVDRAKA